MEMSMLLHGENTAAVIFSPTLICWYIQWEVKTKQRTSIRLIFHFKGIQIAVAVSYNNSPSFYDFSLQFLFSNRSFSAWHLFGVTQIHEIYKVGPHPQTMSFQISYNGSFAGDHNGLFPQNLASHFPAMRWVKCRRIAPTSNAQKLMHNWKWFIRHVSFHLWRF